MSGYVEIVELQEVVEIITNEVQGPPGPPGLGATVSPNPDNRLVVAGDGGLYVPNDLATDPLAYYILAKS